MMEAAYHPIITNVEILVFSEYAVHDRLQQ